MKDEIIQLLRKSTKEVSGEEICKYFHISRAAIWKHVQELRKDGYGIEAMPHKGYRLVSAPDKLLPREVQVGLRTKKIGRNYIYFDSVESTMDVALRLGMSNEKEGVVVCAEEQTKGKGRLRRKWASPKNKGIYLSILLRPKLPMYDIPKLTLMSAVSLCETIKEFSHIDAEIKWPNDILVKGKKMAGILTEMNAEMDIVHFIVIGIGLNVNTPLNVLPDNSTSMKNELGESISRTQLLQEILFNFEKHYQEINRYGFDSLLEKWKRMSSTIGKDIIVHDAGGQVKGRAIDLDEFGRLVVQDEKGVIFKKASGDVIQA